MGDSDQGYPTFVHRTLEDGPWAGWTVYTGEPFEDHAGPFYYRMDESGAPVCAMRTEAKHMNGGGFMHGGALMTFADYAIFIFARDHLKDSSSVTATLNADFVGAVPPGALLECRGEVELRNVSFAYPQRLGESSDTGSSAVWCGAALKVC